MVSFVSIGMSVANHTFKKVENSPGQYLNKHALRVWKENYGVSPKVARHAWMKIYERALKTPGATADKFFWALKVLKLGGTQNSLAASLGTSAKTLRKWFWFYLNLLSDRVSDVVSNNV